MCVDDIGFHTIKPHTLLLTLPFLKCVFFFLTVLVVLIPPNADLSSVTLSDDRFSGDTSSVSGSERGCLQHFESSRKRRETDRQSGHLCNALIIVLSLSPVCLFTVLGFQGSFIRDISHLLASLLRFKIAKWLMRSFLLSTKSIYLSHMIESLFNLPPLPPLPHPTTLQLPRQLFSPSNFCSESSFKWV